MGRPKKPDEQKVIQGTFRHDRANPNAPVYPNLQDLPKPPAFLNSHGKKEWVRVAEEMQKAGTLATIVLGSLELYCETYGRWREALAVRKEIKKRFDEENKRRKEVGENPIIGDGLWIITPNGSEQQHPIVGTINQAAEKMYKFQGALGINPASRTKVSSAGGQKKEKTSSGFGATRRNRAS